MSTHKSKYTPPVVAKQVLVFLKEWYQPGCVPKARNVKIEARPDRIWTLYRHTDENQPPQLPFLPVHNHNAFLEDYVHDWNERRRKDGSLELDYASRVVDSPVWILMEYYEKQEKKEGK